MAWDFSPGFFYHKKPPSSMFLTLIVVSKLGFIDIFEHKVIPAFANTRNKNCGPCYRKMKSFAELVLRLQLTATFSSRLFAMSWRYGQAPCNQTLRQVQLCAFEAHVKWNCAPLHRVCGMRLCAFSHLFMWSLNIFTRCIFQEYRYAK